MNVLTPKELNRLPREAAEKMLLESGYARMPTQQDEVWGRQEGSSLRLMACGPEGWHEPEELLLRAASAPESPSAPVRLVSGETLVSAKERVEGREVYKPEDPRCTARYLKVTAVVGDDRGKTDGQERYLMIHH